MNQFEIHMQLPAAIEDFGRWLEQNNATIEISCSDGQYQVTVTRGKLHSYSCEHGRHSEQWVVTRYGRHLVETMGDALRESAAGIAP